MATRFYFTAAHSALTAAFDASWELTSSAVRRVLSPAKIGTGFVSLPVAETNASTSYDVLVAQFISPALAAQTISGAVKGVLRALESATDADFRAQLVIRVVNVDGLTFRGTLLAADASALSNEFAAALTNRKFPLNWAASPGTAISSLAVEEGDRLVVEVGYRAHNNLTGSRSGTIEIGDASVTDLAENETDVLQNNPWIEFDDTITFADKSSRSASGSPLITQLGDGFTAPARGESYALAGVTTVARAGGPPAAIRRHTRGLLGEAPAVTRYGDRSFFGISGAAFRSPVRGVTLRSPVGGSGFPSGGSSSVVKYKMRAAASPGPGYVVWVVSNTPDFAGTSAPGAIIPSTAVVAASWVEG